MLAWLEGSALGYAIRNSGVWTYSLLNLTHILGIASLFGSVLALDLRLLGAWRSVPVGETVTAYGPRHKDPKTFEIKTERLRWKDRLFNVYPDRS